MASANYHGGYPGINNETGTADLLTFDEFLNPLGVVTTLAQTYSGTMTAPGNFLFLPNRFAGFIQGSSLYFSQSSFDGLYGPWAFNALDTGSGTLTTINSGTRSPS